MAQPAGAVNTTYLAAVKPVGSKILFNFNIGGTGEGERSANRWSTGQTAISYDFLISQDYIVSGLEVTKTVDNLITLDGGTGVLTVKVEKIDNNDVSTTIAQCVFITTDRLIGLKQIAGKETSAVPIGTSSSRTHIYGNGDVFDPEILIQAQKKTTAGVANSQQKIRLTFLPSLIEGTGMNPDCFVEIQLANACLNGEVLTPSNVEGVAI